MALMHIKPNKKMYIRHSVFMYIFGIAQTIFSMLWLWSWLSFMFKRYLLGVMTKAEFVPAILGPLIAIFFFAYGIFFSFGFYKKRSKDVTYEDYYITENQVIIERHDEHTGIDYKDIKEIIVVHPLVYCDKNCVDIYFRRSEKEVILTDDVFSKGSSFKNHNIKRAERMIGVEDAEETVKKIIEVINKNREDNVPYTVKRRL